MTTIYRKDLPVKQIKAIVKENFQCGANLGDVLASFPHNEALVQAHWEWIAISDLDSNELRMEALERITQYHLSKF